MLCSHRDYEDLGALVFMLKLGVIASANTIVVQVVLLYLIKN